MSNKVSVLIVGAGPTGLMMACELARYGVSFRIIDKKSEPTLGSNATWIQPGTLEIFDHLNIANQFIKAGHLCEAIHLHSKEKDLARIPLNQLESKYQFILMLPQSVTERLLNEYLEKLGIKVERSLELTQVKQENNNVISSLKNAHNQNELITSDWLIACDGANSTVRECCGIVFPGEDLPEQFMVADAHMNSFMPNNEVHVFIERGRICGVFPMGKNDFRINANLHQDAPRKLFIDKEVKEIISERTYGAYNVNSVSWISPFWIHGKMVDQMRHRAIFFAGDAAHIHSPAGGQGMNAGIQDAYNLAWKLALVIKGKAKTALLDSYQLERAPVNNEIVNDTERYTRMALTDKSILLKLRRLNEKLVRSPTQFLKKMTMALTQLDIRYQDSPVIDYLESIYNKSPKQGEHAPNVVLDQSSYLYDYLRNRQHNILLFCGPKIAKKHLSTVLEMQKFLNQKCFATVKVQLVSTEQIADADDIILDRNARVHARYHLKGPAVYIIRPDNYIAYCSKSLDKDSINQFIQLYL